MAEQNVVIDIECFRHGLLDWIVKEIAVSGAYLDSISLKEPLSFEELSKPARRSYAWVAANLHGMAWYSGQYEYDRLYSFIESIKLRYPDAQFYAKGLEKCKFLSRLFKKKFFDLGDIDCPRVDQLNTSDFTYCPSYPLIHSENLHCARRKAKAYSNWLLEKLIDGDFEDSFIKSLGNLNISK